MPFQKGNKLGRGRPKMRDDVVALCRAQTARNVEVMMEMRDGAEEESTRLRAALMIHEIAWGKPVLPTTHDVPQGGLLADILRNLPRTVGIPTGKL